MVFVNDRLRLWEGLSSDTSAAPRYLVVPSVVVTFARVFRRASSSPLSAVYFCKFLAIPSEVIGFSVSCPSLGIDRFSLFPQHYLLCFSSCREVVVLVSISRKWVPVNVGVVSRTSPLYLSVCCSLGWHLPHLCPICGRWSLGKLFFPCHACGHLPFPFADMACSMSSLHRVVHPRSTAFATVCSSDVCGARTR